tara:strand:- start:190 stop:591 length:402 start_codon:yes stop_codon:yes gene_type:complete
MAKSEVKVKKESAAVVAKKYAALLSEHSKLEILSEVAMAANKELREEVENIAGDCRNLRGWLKIDRSSLRMHKAMIEELQEDLERSKGATKCAIKTAVRNGANNKKQYGELSDDFMLSLKYTTMLLNKSKDNV